MLVNNPLQEYIQKACERVVDALSIDIFVNVEESNVEELFGQAKYSIKYDEKGWANNASALINSLAYGSIVYTSWGMCTSKEVLAGGKYVDALVLPAGKYSLKKGQHLNPDEQLMLSTQETLM